MGIVRMLFQRHINASIKLHALPLAQLWSALAKAGTGSVSGHEPPCCRERGKDLFGIYEKCRDRNVYLINSVGVAGEASVVYYSK